MYRAVDSIDFDVDGYITIHNVNHVAGDGVVTHQDGRTSNVEWSLLTSRACKSPRPPDGCSAAKVCQKDNTIGRYSDLCCDTAQMPLNVPD